MKTSTRIVLPFFYALMEAYAYNSENDSEEHRKTEQKSSECKYYKEDNRLWIKAYKLLNNKRKLKTKWFLQLAINTVSGEFSWYCY